MSLIIKAARKLFGAKQQQNKKPMRKLTQAQKDKLKASLARIKTQVQQGKLQQVSNVATNYSQGKAVVIQNKNANPKGVTSDMFSVFGQPVPKNYVYAGLGVAALGIGYVVMKHK